MIHQFRGNSKPGIDFAQRRHAGDFGSGASSYVLLYFSSLTSFPHLHSAFSPSPIVCASFVCASLASFPLRWPYLLSPPLPADRICCPYSPPSFSTLSVIGSCLFNPYYHHGPYYGNCLAHWHCQCKSSNPRFSIQWNEGTLANLFVSLAAQPTVCTSLLLQRLRLK